MLPQVWIGRLLWGGCALGVTAMCAGLWGMSVGTDRERAIWQKVVLDMERKAVQAADRARAEYEALESRWQQQYAAALAQGEKERERANRIAADLARARVERDGLRDQIRTYATRGCDTAQGSHAAACERAAALGDLLDESMRVQEDLGRAAETHAADVRKLQGAWPQ